jgi:mannose/cellobiose epimerase-like protein (N-acyl-D-glucosamine 2-epimerase family)
MSKFLRTRQLGWTLVFALSAGCSLNTGPTEESRLAITEANLKATIQQTNSWSSGYCANVDVTNLGSVSVSTWTVVIELNQASIYTSWNGTFSGSGSRETITPVGWNATVAPGAVQSFGYCANTTGSNSKPVVISPTGVPGTGGAGGNAGSGGTGGSGTGGITGTGGVATGGVATGGTATGGVATGGLATGGTATGGIATGGVSTGGVTTTGGSTGYVPTNEFLLHPERSIPVLQSLADFRAKARDNTNGAYFTFTKLDGTVGSDHRKSTVNASRDAWTFTRAFMVTGDDKYLDLAAHALKFLYAHGWDNTRGGWYFTTDEFGNLTPYTPGWDPNTWKWSFVQHYALLGIGAYCEATQDTEACGWLKKGRNFLDTRMWDANAGRLGYYQDANLDMSNPRNKGFTPTVDGLTTNVIQTELMWPTSTSQQRLVDLAEIVTNHFAPDMDLSSVKFGYPENYTTSWAVDTSQTGGDVGHVLKSAWVLARTYLRHPDARYRTAARKFIYKVLNNGGWDEVNGVPYTHYDWKSGQITKQAECWQIEQAIVSGLSNWYIADNQTDRDTFLKMADRSMQFFYNYVIDHTNGGTYKMNSVTGGVLDTVKGNFYNVEYHSTETFYFTYLYGSLMLQRMPVALYYKVPASTIQQVVQLTPLGIDDASMKIKSVTLNGMPLDTFSSSTREVTLAAGQGGKLYVVFGP